MARLSGLQRQVLALYRAFLRAARVKSPEARAPFVALVRQEFDRQRVLPKGNTAAIEYLLRRGQRQLAVLSSSGVKGVHAVPVERSSSGSQRP